MRQAISNSRRRRLRLIQTAEERSQKQRRLVKKALSELHDTEETRTSIALLKRQMFEDCGGQPSRTIRFQRPDAPEILVSMDQPFLKVGRDPKWDLVLDHPEIKSHQCYLQWIDGHLFCCNVAQCSTFFPGRDPQSVGRWIGLEPIQVGPYELTCVDEPAIASPDFSPLDRSPQIAAEYPRLALQFDEVEQDANLWQINRRLTLIGRGSQCKLRLNHKSVANIHACLVRTTKGCWLIDLINDGTTGVNGRAIQISPLDVGDVIQVGSFHIQVVTSEFSAIPDPTLKPVASAISDKPLRPLKFDRLPKTNPKHLLQPVAVKRESDVLETISQTVNDIKSETQNSLALPRQAAGKTVKPDSRFFPTQSKRKASDTLSATNTDTIAPASTTADTQNPIHPIAESELPIVESVGLGDPRAAVTLRIQPGQLANEMDHSIIDVNGTCLRQTDPVLDRMSNSISTDRIVQTPDDARIGLNVIALQDEIAPVGQAQDSALVTEFLQLQKSHLDTLKSQLSMLKRTYDDAMGNLISKRLRDSLEKPVLETMRCYDSMKESLDRLASESNLPAELPPENRD